MFWFHFHDLFRLHWNDRGLDDLNETTIQMFKAKEHDSAWLDKAKEYGLWIYYRSCHKGTDEIQMKGGEKHDDIQY